jgi:organic hydroperoxide reductase OsmC/OhrA
MHEYQATVTWKRGNERFVDSRYSRVHEWIFDGGVIVPASAAPANVIGPYTSENAVDPEEAFVAAVSSCHMLWFLALAAKRKWVVDSYVDVAIGLMDKNANGKVAITNITLRPAVAFGGQEPSFEDLVSLHHKAHEECFIANSVKSEIVVEPVKPDRKQL